MTKKAKKRIMAAEIHLTKSAFKQVEEIAFKNCRTISQELSYMIERQLDKKENQSVANDFTSPQPVFTYDSPTQEKKDSPELQFTTSPVVGNVHWTEEGKPSL